MLNLSYPQFLHCNASQQPVKAAVAYRIALAQGLSFKIPLSYVLILHMLVFYPLENPPIVFIAGMGHNGKNRCKKLRVLFHFKCVNFSPLMGVSLFPILRWKLFPLFLFLDGSLSLSFPSLDGRGLRGGCTINRLSVLPPCLRATHRQVNHPAYWLIHKRSRAQRFRVTLPSLTLPVCTMRADMNDGNLHSIVIPAEAGIHSYCQDLLRYYYQFRCIDNSEN